MKPFKIGDYVLATKYHDGDPGDQFCIGYYNGYYGHYGEIRHLIVDRNKVNFRHNGFRRVEHIGAKRGTWMVNNILYIEQQHYSIWHWWRAPWHELKKINTLTPMSTRACKEQ